MKIHLKILSVGQTILHLIINRSKFHLIYKILKGKCNFFKRRDLKNSSKTPLGNEYTLTLYANKVRKKHGHDFFSSGNTLWSQLVLT